eukprot:CAMPEP_0201909474 /NCGR_PEP_ID=MMETSP0903-20130614/1229_1 /ASSEMBLY_ACC=CAM_ASM_000552 /TAXON_ID=420261 /ORGANISM="Thalassiosira antarctica, Strain CCMP982" /LENGTH=847 /DNA_ID=CAMNT_0048444009 /DNA_START=6 /DNA_END=2549 /DNA_ORIENTATION=+
MAAADPSPLSHLSHPQQQHTGLPQSQLPSSTMAEVMKKMKPVVATGNAAAVGGKSTTRVLLRVKRRRPSPTDAVTPSSGANGAEIANVGSIAPDRIRLALATDGRSSKKRRRFEQRAAAKKEELALIQRLDSAVSIHHNNNDSVKNEEGMTDKDNAVFHTPPRKSAGGNNPYDPMSDMSGGRATPPPSSPAGQRTPPSSSATTNATNNHTNDMQTPQKETPAPPTKPKRTVLFRKITDLQKRLDPMQQLSGDVHPEGSNPPLEKNNENATAEDATAWSSKGEEKSKWLRIVDVVLKEEEDQVSSICSNESATAAADGGKNDPMGGNGGEERGSGDNATMGGGNILGSGQRVRRMRPRPTMEDDNDPGGHGGGGRKKRRKLGWVVEQSRTVLESEFWNGPTATANTSSSSTNTNHNTLDPEVLRLIEYSLSALHQQGGGSIAPHLSFLKNDPRLQFVADTPKGRRMVNHALATTTAGFCGSTMNTNQEEGGRGRTVLHIAALWGDLSGITTALEMGADPTIFDGHNKTPAGLARMIQAKSGVYTGGCSNHYDDVVSALVEGEKRSVAEKNIRSDGNDGGEEEYYYEVYCLETENESGEAEKGGIVSSDGSAEEKKDDSNPSSKTKSPFLQYTDSIPDLERSSGLSEEDDDDTNNSSGMRGNCALIELQKGFGYWNERGELILEAAAGDGGGDKSLSAKEEDERFVQRFYHDGKMEDGDDSMGGGSGNYDDEEHDSNDEGYDGNDYPNDDASIGINSEGGYDDYRDADAYSHASGCSDDDDSTENDWKSDFRNRFVTKKELNHQYGFGVDGYNNDGGGSMMHGDMEAEVRDGDSDNASSAYDPDGNGSD